MFPSDHLILLLMELLQEEIGVHVTTETGDNCATIWAKYPGIRPIAVNLYIRDSQLFMTIAPRMNHLEGQAAQIRRDVRRLILKNLPQAQEYQPNPDDALRKAQRNYGATGAKEDKEKYMHIAKRSGVCFKCQAHLLIDACQSCNEAPCDDCNKPVNCERCTDYVCKGCQIGCTHCGMIFCYACVDKCPHCKNEFCMAGKYHSSGDYQELPGCLPPDSGGHGCPEWDDQDED